MRGFILWAAVGVAAIATGLGLYVTALQTSPATITSPPADAAPAASQPPSSAATPGRPAAGWSDDHGERPDDHRGAREPDDD